MTLSDQALAQLVMSWALRQVQRPSHSRSTAGPVGRVGGKADRAGSAAVVLVGGEGGGVAAGPLGRGGEGRRGGDVGVVEEDRRTAPRPAPPRPAPPPAMEAVLRPRR